MFNEYIFVIIFFYHATISSMSKNKPGMSFSISISISNSTTGIVSVLGRDKGYPVKYNPLPEGVPEGTPEGKGLYLTV